MRRLKETNKGVRIEGYITDACLMEPKARRYGDEPLYSVNIQPLDPTLFTEIELREEGIRRATELAHKKPDSRKFETDHYSKIVIGSSIRMESKFPPRLYGELKSFIDDSEFSYKHVHAVGNWQVLPDGNSFISCHIIEPVERGYGLDAGD